jgi:transcriptional regulator with XRE-family HTH domain
MTINRLELLGSTIKGALPFSITQSAKIIGISKAELSNICKGKRKKPNPTILSRIAKHTNLDEQYLIKLAYHEEENNG